MRAHGGGCPVGMRAGPAADEAVGGIGALRPPAGFRHFLGPPDRVFLVDGADPRHDPAAHDRLRHRMAAVARLIDQRSAPSPTEKPGLPSGYTYLAQLCAHDMIDTSLPFWALRQGAETRNQERRPLRLNTIYGGGPGGDPLLYEPDAGDGARVRLRLGQVGPLPAAAPDFRDIPRVSTQWTSGGTGRPALSEPLLADERNDDHVIVSQLTTLFLRLHNALADRLPGAPAAADLGERLVLTEARFACAKAATTLIWRRLLRDDLLPRLLHPAVAAHYAGGGGFLDGGEEGLALEFAVGTFRFGHAMARDSYRIAGQDFSLRRVLQQTSQGLPEEMPLTADWLVDWHHFFPLEGRAPANVSRPIGPRGSGQFGSGRFGAIDDTGKTGLAYRDLLAAGLAGLWSVGALVGAIRAHQAAGGLAALLGEGSAWQAPMRGWLAGVPAGALSDGTIGWLVADPPFSLYVLAEADAAQDHSGLGPLGSILLAEAVLGILARAPLPAETAAADQAGRLGWLSRAHFGADHFAGLPELASVPDLIAFLSA